MKAGVAADRERAEGVFGRQRRSLTLGILLAVLAFAADGMAVVPAMPTAVRALGGLPLFGWAFSAFLLAWLVGTVAGGQLADRHGPRRPMAVGLSAFGGGLLLSAGAGGMSQFLAGRVLQGLGGGGMIAAAYVAVYRGYPDSLRARMMALTATVWMLPALVGPTISGAIAERASWRLVFAGIVPLLVVVAVLVLPPLRSFAVTRPAPASSRVPTALRLALGAGLVLGAPSGRAAGLPLWATGLLGGFGLALLVPALRVLLPPGTLRARRGLAAGLACRGLLAISFLGTEAFVPLLAGELRNVSPTRAGLALTASALGWVAASWVFERLEVRGGSTVRIRLVRAGFLLVAGSLAAVGAVLSTALPFLLIPLAWVVGGAGIGLAYCGLGLLCQALAPPNRDGEVAGQLQLVEALGTALATGIGGLLLAGFGPSGPGLRLATGALFAEALFAALLGAALATRITKD